MHVIKHFYCLLVVFLVSVKSFCQLGFSHELGLITGPVVFRSDFGERGDFETNAGNTGWGGGIVHYLNFSYRADCNCYTTDNFWNDHVKLRTEISYMYSELDHFGKWVNKRRKSEAAKKLRAHTAIARNIDIGMQFELYFNSIRSFQAFGYKFNPFISLGTHFTSYMPKVYTTYGDGDISYMGNFYPSWSENVNSKPVSDDSGSIFSIVASTGVRYKLTMLSDLLLDLRWQYFGNDWLDGLNHGLDSNKTNDWLNWLSLGYIYYLD